VRCVAEGGATILYDEIDALFGTAAREEANADVRSILNGGYRRGAKVHRCVMVGKRVEVEQLNAFAPVALAGLKNLPDALASRAIIIRMRRRAPDETVESWRERRVRPVGSELCQRITNWAARQADLASAEPGMPSGIVDRAAECWDPLLAVADAAGGDWPKRAREAAVHLVAGGREESTSSGVELLEHIREAFDGADLLATEVLLKRLHERAESPWTDMRGKPLNDRGLARRLKAYGIRSTKIRVGEATPRGYRAEDFAESWKRYLPLSSGEGAEQVERVEHASHCKPLDVPHVPDVPLDPSSNGSGAALARDAAGHPDPRMAVDLGGGQFGTIVGATVGDCEQCGRSDGALYLIRGTREVAANLLHEVCAAAFFISERRR